MRIHKPTQADAVAILKSIRRNHPFFGPHFRSGMTYGWDWQTFNAYYPRTVAIIRSIRPIAYPVSS